MIVRKQDFFGAGAHHDFHNLPDGNGGLGCTTAGKALGVPDAETRIEAYDIKLFLHFSPEQEARIVDCGLDRGKGGLLFHILEPVFPGKLRLELYEHRRAFADSRGLRQVRGVRVKHIPQASETV
ncbi:MAG: hypothetical protein DELT_03232 [Desulfovibrio sp.]